MRESGQLGEKERELDVAIDGEDFGVAGDVSELIVMLTWLDLPAITTHKLDFVVAQRVVGVVVPCSITG